MGTRPCSRASQSLEESSILEGNEVCDDDGDQDLYRSRTDTLYGWELESAYIGTQLRSDGYDVLRPAMSKSIDVAAPATAEPTPKNSMATRRTY